MLVYLSGLAEPKDSYVNWAEMKCRSLIYTRAVRAGENSRMKGQKVILSFALFSTLMLNVLIIL